MDTEIKKKWVEALRSGEYEQTSGSLRVGDTFCCLGVLCDILDPEGWTNPDLPRLLTPGQLMHSGEPGYLPKAFAKAASLDLVEAVALADMNDGGSTFTEIADYIEENL